MANDVPNSYKDPYWADLASSTESKLGLPVGLLASIVTHGERSNHDDVSEAGARTVFQITPKTRDLVLKRDGIDAYLSPQNAAEVAGLVLKDGLNWAKKNAADPAEVPSLAAGYYHAGGDPANWGPKTRAYVERVGTGAAPVRIDALENGFADFMAAHPAVPDRPAATPSTNAAAPQGSSPDALEQGFAQFLANPNPESLPANDPRVQRSGIGAIPNDNGTYPNPGFQPQKPHEQGLYDALVGTLEGGANAATGLVGSLAGQATGGIQAAKDIAGLITQGANYRPQQTVQQAADSTAQALTYQPRTESGQRQAAAIQDGMQQLVPLGPLAGEMAGLSRSLPAVTRAVGDVARATPSAISDAAEAGMLRLRPGAVTAATPDAAMTGEELAQTAKKAANGGIGSTQASADLAGQAAPDPEVLASAKRIGVENYLQPDHVTANQAYKELAQAVKSIPGSDAHAAETAGLLKVAERADALITELGGGRDLSTTSANVKGHLASSIEALDKKGDELYARVGEKIPRTADAPATNVLDFIATRADDLGGVKNLSPMEKSIVDRLSPKAETRTEMPPTDPSATGLMLGKPAPRTVKTVTQPTYSHLDDVRRELGSALRNAGPFKDADVGLAKKLYGLLSQDQSAVADAHGATKLLRVAQRTVEMRKRTEQDMQSLFGKALDGSIASKIPSATQAAGRGDTANLVRILQAVPNELRQEVVASGVATALRAGSADPVSFGRYAKWFEGLKQNRQAMAVVMSHLPRPARQQLIDLYKVSKGISSATRERITTGRIQAITDQFKVADTMINRFYDVARRSAAGAAAGTVVTPFLGPGVGAAVASALTKQGKSTAARAVDSLIVSPEFVHAARTAGTPASKAAVTRMANSKPFRRFLRATDQQATIKNKEQWLMQAMRAPTAQNEQQRKQ